MSKKIRFNAWCLRLVLGFGDDPKILPIVTLGIICTEYKRTTKLIIKNIHCKHATANQTSANRVKVVQNNLHRETKYSKE